MQVARKYKCIWVEESLHLELLTAGVSLRAYFHRRLRPLIFNREMTHTNWRENKVSGRVP